MKITFKSLTLTNFKGIRSLSIQFGEQETVISGENGTGKTTVFDAVTWLLFDKDSTGASRFNIKTLDENNKVIEKIEHEVVGVINTGYEDVTLKKVLREKWQKKKGALEPEFTGNEVLYYCNDVPLKESEYKMKVDSILKEELFKLVTSPYYFNSLKWTDRRNVLTKMAGNVSDSEIATQKTEFSELLTLIGNKSFEEYKREIASRKKKLNDDLKMIPTRVDELLRSIPQGIDFDTVAFEVGEYEKQIKSLDEQITDKGSLLEAFYSEKQKKQEQLSQLNSQKFKFEQEANAEAARQNSLQNKGSEDIASDIRTLEGVIANATEELKRLEKDRDSKADRRTLLEGHLNQLREDWEVENAKVLEWGENDFVCPCCHRPFEADNIEAKKAEMLKNFNEAKNKKLDDIDQQGVTRKTELDGIKQRIEVLTKDILQISEEQDSRRKQLVTLKEKLGLENKEVKLVTAAELLAANLEHIKLKNQIQDLKEEIDLMQPNVDTSELKEKKANIQNLLEASKKTLAVKDQIEKTEQRISELKGEEKNLSQQIADLEKSEFVMQEFTKTKIDTIEARINGMFSLVKFKMFEQQVNGGESETCECTINGVPYSDLNTASKINAGLDIINALCSFYQVSAPIFIDGRESINDILPVQSQVVNLVVSKEPFKVTQLN